MLQSLSRIIQAVNAASSLEDALEVIVQRIRTVMHVDICCVYLTVSDSDENVLMAAHGLNPEMIGHTRLRADEGLVGLVARSGEPINIEDAAAHPSYKFVPNIGEEQYHGFLGVPIVHYRNALGVLIVQQRAARRFEESEVAFLVTLAAQLAGSIAYAQASGAIQELHRIGKKGYRLEGEAGAPGLALGTVLVSYSATKLRDVPDRTPVDIAAEEEAFRNAAKRVVDELRTLSREGDQSQPFVSELHALADAYAMIASSDEWISSTIERIRAGNWAPGALRQTVEEYVKQFEAMDNPYLSARASDILELGRRTFVHLQRQSAERSDYPERIVLVGEDPGLFDLLGVPRERLVGVVCGHGSAYSHVAILAHVLGIPAVMGVGMAPFARLEGLEAVVDGYGATAHIAPSPSVRREFMRLLNEEQQLAAELEQLRDSPAVTLDGKRVELQVNAGLTMDGVATQKSAAADGVGLYRTELPFLIADRFPSEETQCKNYRRILEHFAPRPVVIRTLDIGGDKALPYFPVVEVNPSLGWRGIRMTLDHPEIFLPQLRAMVRASEGLDNLRILFPMVTTVEELDAAIALLRQAVEELRAAEVNVTLPPIGVMIEVPAAAFQMTSLLKRVDFVSVGSNDLTQYLLAIDRNNERVARLFDSLHPAVLRVLCEIVDATHRSGKKLSVCGEMASEAAGSLLLLGMDVDGLSTSAGDLLRIKWVIRSFSRTDATTLLEQALECETASSVRKLVNTALEEVGLGGLVRPGR